MEDIPIWALSLWDFPEKQTDGYLDFGFIVMMEEQARVFSEINRWEQWPL